jgi:poly-gamma-glutamate capsule biosynthesis protein CapA/YwtB (metallophosphatase superfamily)
MLGKFLMTLDNLTVYGLMNDLLTIGFAGDVMLGRTLDKIISQRGYDFPWGNVLGLMKNTDMNIINLETTLTNSRKQVYKTFNFKASPDKVQSLVNANITVANLANNHIMDFDREGLLETIEMLDNAGIKHVGAGRDSVLATAPVRITKKNIRIGVLGLTDNEADWKASTEPGTYYINMDDKIDQVNVLHAIRKLREETDILIVSIHWGPNMREQPTEEFINFAHAMADHGAQIIHGHSAHIFQGIDNYNNKLILYDTGDFVDDYAVNSDLRNDLSAFFIVTVNKFGVVNVKLLPVRIFQYQVNQATGEDYDWILKRIKHLSSAFDTSIDDEGKITFNSAYFFDNK